MCQAKHMFNQQQKAPQKIHSFIISNHFIFVRVPVGLEPILGTLGTRWEYNLNETLNTRGHQAHTLLNSHSHLFYNFTIARLYTFMFLRGERKWNNLEETHKN